MPNILVEEGDTSLQETIVDYLSSQEFNGQAMGDGITALEVAQKNHPP